jgi:hypothetical protein
MNLDFKKLFPRGKKPPVTIRVLRNMRLNIDGTSEHVPSGEMVTISHDEFSQLEAGDYTLISTNAVKLEVTDPTPARPEPEPSPTAWVALPPCFAEYHTTESEITAARQHIELIRGKRKEIFGTAEINFDGATGAILAGGISAQPLMNPVSTLRPINLDDPTNQKLARFLRVAEDNARDFLARLIESRNFPQQRLFLECGNHRIDAAEDLQGVIQKLADTGYQIFALRLQALGLAEHQVRKLFIGSADFIRFSSQQPAYVGGVCFGGYEDGGTVRRYSDLPVASSAGHLLRDRERLAELTPLLKSARAELAKAEKASMPAGLSA